MICCMCAAHTGATQSATKILENCKYILIGNKYGVSDGMKAEMTLTALKGKVMLYEQDGKIYLVDSREETTGGQDNE